MVDAKTIQKQLKRIKFGGSLWNQAELRELPKIIHGDEQISECVNGFYEGGVALLVATELRVLLVDKKPLNFLTVEDLRFDMINEIDYSHRLMGATITISTGGKTLRFTSLNQQRLRHLINLVQEHMSDNKKKQEAKAETQQQHLEEINKQLQMYLLAQHQQLQQVVGAGMAAPPKPDPQLSDYLFAQRLLEQFYRDNGGTMRTSPEQQASTPSPLLEVPSRTVTNDAAQHSPVGVSQNDVEDAKREVFGGSRATASTATSQDTGLGTGMFKGVEVSPLRIAYSRLPMMLRNRKFGRPSFHAHAGEQTGPIPNSQAAPSST